ncbi:tRNA N(3)-methylcytidine methyltransferase METTL6 [Macrosteles quadrilineatus]|uniref:tRNA N(3)-methylcytidine methyltransferase METTL6 n=1 Tax=Macrosteles quadrilineatus TaxID=74068 RepID=UPI0023E16B9F|nr:tRNA N(3)-methylcytidine methyltransferase METTL6 [Macrosteles quadrilineatus]
MDEKLESESDCTTETKNLTNEEIEKLQRQNSRMISDFVAKKLNSESKKHWDLFYKRNETRFFKDRHWTTREFEELVGKEISEKCVLLEVGCGVGNFVYPLFEENANFFIYACDISSKAIDLLKQNESYCENKIKAFQTDITTENILDEIPRSSVDIITLIFVLSAIDPSNFSKVATTLFSLLKPGGYVLFRDYGLYDMTQLRFKPGHKISENFYMRQDGTRSYFFSVEFLGDLFTKAGFKVVSNCYVHRRTINVKEGIDVPRIFVQAKFLKPVLQNEKAEDP